MKEYWILVAGLGMLLVCGIAIVLLGTKLAKLAQADAAPNEVVSRLEPDHSVSDSPFHLSRKDALAVFWSRRTMQFTLGLVWLLDGVFQLKPDMFTTKFATQVILPMVQGQPAVIASLVTSGAHLVAADSVVWNSLFAAVQIGLGVSLIANVKVKQVIIASVLWSVVVWVFGEGFGQVFTDQSLLLNGAPGAAIVYALLGLAVWPPADGSRRAWHARGTRFAQVSLGAIMALDFLLHLRLSAFDPNVLSQAVSVPWLAAVIGSRLTSASLALGIVELCLAVMLFFKVGLRTATLVCVVLSLVYWWVGQSFGQVAAPLATDFNTGLVLALLALCAYPAAEFRERSLPAVPLVSSESAG